MTTVYTDVGSYEGISYRTKIDYTITSTDTSVSVAITAQLQYKGTYKNESMLGASIHAGIGNANGLWYMTDVTGTDYNINASNFPSKSSWTNKGSSISKTYTHNKEKSSYVSTLGGSVETSAFATSVAKTFDVTVPALQSWPVTYKNNDGTSDSFYSTNKYYGIDLTYPTPNSSVIPERTGFFPRRPSAYSVYYTLNTAPDGSGTEITTGNTVYSSNAAITVYLMWDSHINYDGNGISLPSYIYSQQTKHEYESIVLNSNTPTRSGYVFKEWNTAADGTGTAYSPGDTYSADIGEVTLYAIWLTMPAKPQIGNMTAIRSNAQGQQDDTGTYASISADWSVDTTSEAYPQNTGTVTGTITPQSTGVEQSFTFSSGSSGTSGTAIALISGLDTDEQYLVKVTVTDQVTSTSKTVILTRAFFIMDFKAGGKGIGIGRAAPNEGLEIGYETTFDDDVTMLENLHAHVTDQAAIANGDKLLFSDSSDSGKIVRASIAFDGTTINQLLSRKGTWELATDVPTSNVIAKYDSNKHLNSKDMTSQEISDFVNGLNSSGTGLETTQTEVITRDDLTGILNSLLSIFYPVGSYYETSLSATPPSGGSTPTQADIALLGSTWFDPRLVWPGQWELEASGKFHMSAGTGWSLGATGGSPNAVVVKHNHQQNAHHHIAFKYKTAQIPTGTSGAIRVWDYAHSGDSTANTNDVTATNIEKGEDGTNKNLPPYIVVNRWHRTA